MGPREGEAGTERGAGAGDDSPGPGHDQERGEAMTTGGEDATNLLPTNVFRVKLKISSL